MDKSNSHNNEKSSKNSKKKPLIDATNCVGCSVCVEVCPRDCLEISKPAFRGDIDTFVTIVDDSQCIGCEMCASACPLKVICMVEQGVSCK